MLQTSIMAPDPADWLARTTTDAPVHFYCPAALDERHAAFRAGFPGQVTYAVKANPAEAVIAQLAAGGMTAFDVASPDEIALVRRISPGASLHYHNPVRSRSEVALADAAGILSWSVDDAGELSKLLDAGVRGEIAVRLALPVAGAAYDFGAKFGAAPDACVALLRQVVAAGRVPAMTFHVGTQCSDPQAWAAYGQAAADVARRAGMTLARLNVGGGFASGRDGGAVDHAPVFRAVRQALAAFDLAPPLVCEPGRGLVADAFAYAVRIKARRGDTVYLTDGIYGAMSEFPSIGLPAIRVIGDRGRQVPGDARPMTAWGPTCDSLDRLPGAVSLPSGIAEGDWLLMASMGAYVTGVQTRFNGYGAWDTVTVAAL